jgi:hypothetical protein
MDIETENQLPEQQGVAADTPGLSDLSPSKYGATRLARYLVRTFDDCFDVCETLSRRIQENVDPGDIEPVFRGIECWAMPVPKSVSSIIVGLGVPSSILDDQKTGSRPVKFRQIDFTDHQKPLVRRSEQTVVIAQDVKSFYDLQAFHHFMKDPQGLATEGVELALIRRTIRLRVKKQDGVKANFSLILACSIPAVIGKSTVAGEAIKES